MKNFIKNIAEKIRYLPPHQFSYLTNTLAIFMGITLVLIDPYIYILLSIISFVLNTIHVFKINKNLKQREQ